MRPIEIELCETLPMRPDEVAEQLLDLRRWPDFEGYGLIPGVESARFIKRSDDIVGSLIEVSNLDGTVITQRIDHWDPERELRFVADELPDPMCRIAERFEEQWLLAAQAQGTEVTRRVSLVPKNLPGKLAMRALGPLLRRALQRHMMLIVSRAKHAARQSGS